MSDLVERVADAIATVEMGEGDLNDRARAAIAEVRRFDVERGPSDAEIEAMVIEMGKISGYGSSMKDLMNELGTDDVDYMAVEVKETWAAAARVRQEEAE